MAEATSPYGARILEMDISLELGLLVCGDRWGNVAAFSLPEQALSCEGGVNLPLWPSSVHLSSTAGVHEINHKSQVLGS